MKNNKRHKVISSILLSVIGMSVFLILPLLIGAAVNSLGFDEQSIGFMASSIMFASALSSIIAITWIRKINWHLAGYSAVFIMCISHICALFISHQVLFVILMSIAAFGGGTLYSIALTVLSDSKNADRNFGFSIAAQVLFQVIGLMILPKLTAQDSINNLLVLFIVLEVIGLFLIRWLPINGVKNSNNNNSITIKNIISTTLKPKTSFALLGCFMFFCNVGVIWTYIERMGNNAGFSNQDIGLALSIGTFFGIPGALLASWIGERFSYIRPLCLGVFMTVVSIGMLMKSFGFIDYIIALVLYNFFWNFSLSFQYSVVNSVDITGRGVAAAPAFHAMGVAVGPAIAALYVTSNNFNPVNFLAISAVIISLLFFFIAITLHKKDRLTNK